MMNDNMNADSVQEEEKNVNIVEFFENKLNFEFDEYIKFVKGEVISNGQTYQVERCCAMLVKVNKASEEKFLELLEGNCIRIRKTLPSPSWVCSIGDEFEEMDLKASFLVMKAGKYVRTKHIFIYVACDGDDMYALFKG